MADRRIVINGGAMARIIETDEREKKALVQLERADSLLYNAREKLRKGQIIQ